MPLRVWPSPLQEFTLRGRKTDQRKKGFSKLIKTVKTYRALPDFHETNVKTA
jgi:hypothetical protein